MRLNDRDWLTLVTTVSARIETEANGDWFFVLGAGHRYDLKPETSEMRFAEFDAFGVRIESKNAEESLEQARATTLESRRTRPTELLNNDKENSSYSQIMWRLALLLAALNLALMAIPLGVVNHFATRLSGKKAQTFGCSFFINTNQNKTAPPRDLA